MRLMLILVCLAAGCDAGGTGGPDSGGDTAGAWTYDRWVEVYRETYCEWYMGCWAETAEVNGVDSVEECADPADPWGYAADFGSDCFDFSAEAADACLAPYLGADECEDSIHDDEACSAVCR